MTQNKNERVKHKEFVEGCPDCEDLRPAYDPNRVRRAIRRLAKKAMLVES